MKDIVIEITKGTVSGVFCDLHDARFVIVDWDLAERTDGSIGMTENHEPLTSLPSKTKLEVERLLSI